MSIDSSADLLFRIGANSDDAENNIKRFRTLINKDLDDLAGEMSDWSKKVLGELGTVQGAVTAGAAVLAAGVAALGAFANEATNAYADYVAEVARGSKVTGIAIDTMSGLSFAAKAVGVSNDDLVTGLTRFTSTVEKAATGGKAQMAMFEKLGISQDQVKAGEKDMLPLLLEVSDKFHNLGSQVDRVALAREGFGREGYKLTAWLALGSDGIRELIGQANELGVTLTRQDVIALKEYKASIQAIKEQHEALDIQIGRVLLPWKTALEEAALAAVRTAVATISWKTALEALANPLMTGATLFKTFSEQADAVVKETQTLALAGALGKEGLQKTGEGAKQASDSFRGFSSIMDQIRTKTAEASGEEAKLIAEVQHLQDEFSKAQAEFAKVMKEGGLTGEAIRREQAAYVQAAQGLPGMIAQMWSQLQKKQADAIAATETKLREDLIRQGTQTLEAKLQLWDLEMSHRRAEIEKEKGDKTKSLELLAQLEKEGRARIRDEAARGEQKTTDDLVSLLAAQGQQTLKVKLAAWEREIDAKADAYAAEGKLDKALFALLEQTRAAGRAKIIAEDKASHDAEIASLRQHLQQIEREHQTAEQRIQATYSDDVAKFTAAEEKKTLAAAGSDAERARIAQLYAAIRAGLYKKEQQDLQTLRNSQGWQGVFGAQFAQAIRGNDALTKQWASSTNQSLLMVQVALEGLRETGVHAFDSLAQGMGGGIADALVYSKSIGAAMRAALASTLESLAAQSITYAIYSTALGFTRLAEHDPVGAGAAFTAAAIWGSVGAAAAVAGRLVAPSQASASTSKAAGGANASSASVASDSGTPTAQTPMVAVYISGHVIGPSGAEELCNIINDAVENRDVRLSATQVKQQTRSVA